MYLGDVPSDRLTLMNAGHLPGAKMFRAPNGKIMLAYRGDLYEWRTTGAGLAGLDGWFKKLTKLVKRVTPKPLRKLASKHIKLHKKLTKPVRKVVEKYAGVIAPVAAFIPVVGWAVAAALTVVAIQKKRKDAKSAAEAAELDAQLQQAQLDADQKKLEAEQAGYAKEYEAELARQSAAMQANTGGFASGYAGGAAASFAPGGGGGAMGYRGGGEPTGEADATMHPVGQETLAPTDSGASKYLIPALAVGVAALVLLRRK